MENQRTMVDEALSLGGRWLDNPNLILALQLAANGFKVVPYQISDTGNKIPAIKSAHPEGDALHNKCPGGCGRDGHGQNDATDNMEKIEQWWQRYPYAIIGIACEKSGIIALDIDMPSEQHPNRADGIKALKKIAAGCGADIRKSTDGTPMQKTPSGGYHMLFKAPILPNGFRIPGKLADGIDIKYHGCVCTGFLRDGREYKWVDGHEFYEGLREFPHWIERVIIDQQRAEMAVRNPRPSKPVDGTRPGDDYRNRHTWDEVLRECLPGWFIDGEKVYRDDKSKGVKATLRDDVFYIFTEVGLPGKVKSRSSYNKFSLLTDAIYNGDFSAAAKDLSQKGYGKRETNP